ncbi:MAG: 30S ribosomal protein S18 [Acidobacteria bacterium]|jgi:small subunit ribosomal protein S18|nr:MAG: 30S ribosomal protein S18 [Acidobacteriota bacterium]
MPFGQGRSGGGGSGGAGGRGRGRGDKKTGDKVQGQRRPMFRRRKVCKFCADKIDDINYKDAKLIGPFVPERGKILPRRISGTCAMHQRKLQTAIKRARQIALIPYVTD